MTTQFKSNGYRSKSRHDANSALTKPFSILAVKPGGIAHPNRLGGGVVAAEKPRCRRRSFAAALAVRLRHAPLIR